MEDVKSIETVAHYSHDEDQAFCMLYGEGVFDTIPIEADYTVGDMKLWIKCHHKKDDSEYDLVGPKGKWKMGAGSEVLQDEQVISDFMGDRFENKWLMQLSLFPKKKNEDTGGWESTFETIEEWVPPPPEEAWDSEDDDEEKWKAEIEKNEAEG
eukprot:CAMPEP_0119398044 /NCGR_PEP_ID=MMETSP1334-20130426/140643_1 /TAXON_ID=127549 /ORGANISM="Calcidiscus leptoporus, Strain RCC1130" /LENGTH=153 /DNA_ID=CAMNT_0007421895 /DNA_START=48 /DNA_END=509 /DNA_ORIENTATION=+